MANLALGIFLCAALITSLTSLTIAFFDMKEGGR